jgi:transcriptional regulator with XRE-family HTH domain
MLSINITRCKYWRKKEIYVIKPGVINKNKICLSKRKAYGGVLMCIGKNIKKVLKIKKMKQTELASKLGIPVSTLNGYIKERYRPNCEMIKKISVILNVSSDFLLGTGEEKFSDRDDESLIMIMYRTFDERKKKDILEHFKYLENRE